jgi:hypothetical protein
MLITLQLQTKDNETQQTPLTIHHEDDGINPRLLFLGRSNKLPVHNSKSFHSSWAMPISVTWLHSTRAFNMCIDWAKRVSYGATSRKMKEAYCVQKIKKGNEISTQWGKLKGPQIHREYEQQHFAKYP